MKSSIQFIFGRNQVLFYSLCVFFVILNLFTIEWYPLPWIDEVSLHDLSVNLALDGELRTTAVGGDVNNETYSLYVPLYQWILIPWIRIFGLSPLACRSLNLFLVFFACWVMYRFLQDAKIIKNNCSLLIFLLLYWGTDTFSWMFRNGRPDMINMLAVVFFLKSFYNYLYKEKSKWFVALFSFFIFISGIQACPLIVIFLACMYFFHKDRRKIITVTFMFFLGIAGGLILLNIYFYLQGHLLSFYYRTFLFSNSLKSIASFLFPYIDKCFPLSESIRTALLKPSIAVSTSFTERLIEAYTLNKEYLILSAANVTVHTYYLIQKKITFKSVEMKLLFITLIIPLVMTMAGRFAIYYTWMCYVPSIICVIYILKKHSNPVTIGLYGIITLLVIVMGLPRTLATVDRKAYGKMESFVRKQNFNDKDKIISSFTSYYVIRNITKTCYFTGVYPLSLVPEDTKYILNTDDDYGYENTDKYINFCREKGKTVTLVDSLDSPPMKLYLVE